MKLIRRNYLSMLTLSILVTSYAVFVASAFAEGYQEFKQVDDVSQIRQARGSVISLKVLSHDPVETTYYVNGEWVLDCGTRCVDAPLDHIMFDLAHSMSLANESRPPHAHNYSDFKASSVTVTPDTMPGVGDNSKLTISGTITLHKTGSDEENLGITLELFRPTTAGIFSFTLTGTTHIESTIGGVIIESEK